MQLEMRRWVNLDSESHRIAIGAAVGLALAAVSAALTHALWTSANPLSSLAALPPVTLPGGAFVMAFLLPVPLILIRYPSGDGRVVEPAYDVIVYVLAFTQLLRVGLGPAAAVSCTGALLKLVAFCALSASQRVEALSLKGSDE